MRFTVLPFLLIGFVTGCSAGSDGNTSGGGFGGDGAGGSAQGGGGGSPGSGGAGNGGAGSGGFDPTGTGGGGGHMQPSEVFAEGPNTLYKLDPDTKAFTKVGDFVNCEGGVIDIAIDKNGVMFGTTTGGLWNINKDTAVCTLIADGNYPNSLSLVPKGTVDPNEEALVGYNGSTYIRIDKVTGNVTDIGTLQGGYISSGDIVSVIGGGTYLTVNGNDCSDCIIQVDPKTGDMMQMIGHLDHQSVFGLAFWAGAAYGFDDGGKLFEIDLTNGTTTPIQSGGFTVPQFWGAGSTTSAPVVPK